MKKKRQITKKEREAYSLIGKIGGRAKFKKVGRKGMSEMGKLGALKRYGNRAPVDNAIVK